MSSGIAKLPFKHSLRDCLEDILENAARVEDYLNGVARDDFATNGLLRDAVERCIERVCEAASRMGDRAAELMPDQPWGDIRGMGNRLRHAYDRVDLGVVWNAAQRNLPTLAEAARRALRDMPNETDGGD